MTTGGQDCFGCRTARQLYGPGAICSVCTEGAQALMPDPYDFASSCIPCNEARKIRGPGSLCSTHLHEQVAKMIEVLVRDEAIRAGQRECGMAIPEMRRICVCCEAVDRVLEGDSDGAGAYVRGFVMGLLWSQVNDKRRRAWSLVALCKEHREVLRLRLDSIGLGSIGETIR